MNPRPDAVLFDLDDTLFDRTRAQGETLRLIVRDMGDLFGGVDEEQVLDAFYESDRLTTAEYEAGRVLPEGFRCWRSTLFLGLLGLGAERADEVSAAYLRHYPAVDVPVAGARSVVECLAHEFRLGIVSNGMPDVQFRKLDTLGVRHLFECIVLSGVCGIWKPDPRIFRQAAEELGCRPEGCLYVGNSYESDVVGAGKAGMRACWYNPGGAPLPPGGVAPDLDVRALAEIPAILDGELRSA